MNKAQGVLKGLAEMQEDGSELFSQIGEMARLLHSMLKNVAQTLDPELREVLEGRCGFRQQARAHPSTDRRSRKHDAGSCGHDPAGEWNGIRSG
ncbi:MAG: hypothetical protein MZV70_68760 [Desulfobacterales bacterium]|nr:hypothetical protein [Desulfobacterales bacterium]